MSITPTTSEYRKMEEATTLAPLERLEAQDPSQELLTLNMGPHHPATHGVLRLLVLFTVNESTGTDYTQ